MKCAKCNRVLQPGDELKWECNSCHQICRANLQMLEQIQTQRDNGYTAAMVNCPFCGTVLDDGNEKIYWDCIACGERMTGTVKNYVRPELFVEEPEPEQSKDQSEFAWFDSNGEAMEAPPEEPPTKQKSFFADEAEKNEFLAKTKSMTLGEEIPDSVFEDAFPIRKPKEKKIETPTSQADALPPTESIPAGPAAGVNAGGSVPTAPKEASWQGTPQAGNAPTGNAPRGNAPSSPFVEPPRETTQQGTPQTGNAPTGNKSPGNAPSSSFVKPSAETSSDQTPESSVGPLSSLDTDTGGQDVLQYDASLPASKQIFPKILAGILGVFIVAALIVGIFFAATYFLAPTRQFRSAVKAADYTKAQELYNNKIKGDTEDERIAKIAVEHFLHIRYDAFQNGSGDKSAYDAILEFAQNEMGMDTSDYEQPSEPAETPEPTETPAPTETMAEETEPPEATSEVTEEPDATPEATPEATAEPSPEPTPEQAEEENPPAGSEDEISAAIQKANGYSKKKKYEKAYNYLAKYKDSDTSGQIKKEMSSVKKDWKDYNIKTFKELCGKLTIVYYASEKRYHIVPKGYYTNYNQISRSNNVGGIAYMDQAKKKVSITNIGKDGTLSSFGKTNRANLKQFKKMIEKYPYLAKEIK